MHSFIWRAETSPYATLTVVILNINRVEERRQLHNWALYNIHIRQQQNTIDYEFFYIKIIVFPPENKMLYKNIILIQMQNFELKDKLFLKKYP